MIEGRSLGGFDVTCDSCSEDEFFDVDSWQELINEMKSYGWQNIKDKTGDWTHKCPTCVDNSATGDFG